MIMARTLAIAILSVLLSGPVIYAETLSGYREFQFGMTLPAAAKLAGLDAAAAKVIYQRPALIQELNWNPSFSSGTSLQSDPAGNILLSFYNGALFRIVVNYDRYKTQGLTADDLVEAISVKYGAATRPDAETTISSSRGYYDNEVVIARWDAPQYAFTLFHSSYQPTFGMIGISKPVDALAQAAIKEAIVLDKQEAPQREIDRQKKQDEENRSSQENARLANKPKFRP